MLKEELLDYIFYMVSEDCLSDLRRPYVLRKYGGFIQSIDEEQFSIDNWNQALRYLCGIETKAESVKQAKQILDKWSKSE